MGEGEGEGGKAKKKKVKKKKKKKVLGQPIPEGVKLPAKFTRFHDHQARAVDEILAEYEAGRKVVFLDAPTGTGKTLIAEVVGQRMNRRNYTCSTISLQHQFLEDFPYARVVKGRRNYTPTHPTMPDVTCDDCDMHQGDDGEAECSQCENVLACPYVVARDTAGTADLAVLNTAYFLAQTQNPKSMFRRGFAIVDECDLLESELMRFIELRVSRKIAAMVGVEPLKKGVHKSTIQTWLDDELIPALQAKIKGLHGDDLSTQRMRRRLNELLGKVKKVDLVNNDHWVREYDDQHALVMKPYRVHEFGREMIWDKADQWLCMSATIIDPTEMATSLGLGDGEWECVTVPMTFPVKNRPIILAPVANMTRKNMDDDMGKLIAALREVSRQHEGENILVHAVSYNLAKQLRYALGKGSTRAPNHITVGYDNAQGRDVAIRAFKQGANVMVIAPSLDRGVDLPGDLCRVQVIAKVPFPNLGDPLVSARMNDEWGELWYKVQTARSLVQMTGRAVRSRDDHATTYIFDKQFARFLNRGGNKLLPQWWRDGIESVGTAQFTRG